MIVHIMPGKTCAHMDRYATLDIYAKLKNEVGVKYCLASTIVLVLYLCRVPLS